MKFIISERKEIIILISHVLLAFLSLLSKFFFVGWILIILFAALPGLINNKQRDNTILYLSGYFFGLELIGRMIKASPWVPYSVGSYFMLIIFPIGILLNRKRAKSNIGIGILLLCLPGFFMIPGDSFFTYFVNSFSGIICLALASYYFSSQQYGKAELLNFIKCVIYPIITILIYVTLKSPDLEDIQFELTANFDTAGGFGSNQVSTVLGVGACLLLLCYFINEALFNKIKWLSILLIICFIFRGLLTFSRGGIIGAVYAVAIAYIYLSWRIKQNLGFSLFKIAGGVAIFIVLFNITDNISGGLLFDRYRGETQGTKEGYRDRDLNTMTSNRANLALAEWTIFKEHPYLGIGPGAGYEERKRFIGQRIASHTEVTRLLAEHGLPGLIMSFIFLLYPIARIKKAKSNMESYFLIGFFSLAILTSFHSSMRTMVTPLLWGFACARFNVPDTRNISKRPIKINQSHSTIAN